MGTNYGLFKAIEGTQSDTGKPLVAGKWYVVALNVNGPTTNLAVDFDPTTDEIVGGPYDTLADADAHATEAYEQAN